MKLEVGMYVRLQNDVENIVIINKIANVFETTILTENDGSIYQGEYTKENVIKASYNIIDILEERDYVNGCYIQEIKSLKDNVMVCMLDSDYELVSTITNKEIESIVTKEQMEQMAYKVGE